MMERALKNYIEELSSEVASMVYSEGEVSFEEKFTEYCIEVLETIGKTEGARVLTYIHPSSQFGIDWKINGYCLKEQYIDEDKKAVFETLDLFITYYQVEKYDYNISKDEYTKTINQIKRFINASLKGHIDYIDESHTELRELINIIDNQGNDFDRINIYFLINGFSNHDKEKITLNNIDIFIHTWDISRLFKINESNSIHEPIEIEFKNFVKNGSGLQCLQVPSIDPMYDCYLAIIPGEILANLYKEFSNELLESNVRAFLGQAGKFNKGIRETIRNKPQMFLPYNNGITATAESVQTSFIDKQLVITKLNDFQIVNGGQTTASLYHTQKKFKDVDLSKIFVQMKLTVIKDIEQKNIEVPNIARFANSQNKVSELDLSSNNAYLVQIENLSRKKYINNPENRNQSLLWFFERVNGQYRETLNKKTPAQQRVFKEQNPSNQKFVKSDVAKFINLWEQEPHFVSQGSQKNFLHFIKKINALVSKNKLPGDNFYQKLIANAILFKTTDKLFGRKNFGAIGDTNLKSFTVAYCVSYFHFLTDNRIDLFEIYKNQKLTDLIETELFKLLQFTYQFLVEKADGSLISEFAKKETTWLGLKNTNYRINLMKALEPYLISEDEKAIREKEKEINTDGQQNSVLLVSDIKKLGLKFWDGFKIYLKTTNLLDFEYMRAFEINKKLEDTKNLTQSELTFGKKVLEYTNENPSFIEEIKKLSDKVDEEVVELKFIFDKLSLIKKDQWQRMLDLGLQTNTLNNLEISNIKSVRLSIQKKEKIKEQAIIKAFESLSKLKKFGISL